MKTNQALVLGAVVAAFTFSSFAQSGAAGLLRSQPVAQPKVADTTVTTIAYVEAPAALLSPRAQANQIKVLKGVANDQGSTLACVKMMNGNPKAIQACTEHPATMPGCNPVTVAPLK